MMTDTGPGDLGGTRGGPVGTDLGADQISAPLAAIERATMRLMETVRGLDDRSVHQPSLLPGWTRAHVLTHLARNADGYVNLLRWARTGVEHAMYPSAADREAAIEEGAVRGHRLLEEDLIASCTRFNEACRGLPSSAWSTEVLAAPGKPIRAHEILRSRLLEVWVHLVDLDRGFGFDDIPEPDVEHLLEDAVRQFVGRPDTPGVTLTVVFSEDRPRTWELGRPKARARRVHGRPGTVLGWLLGRTGGHRLEGEVPELPTWL
jgi:maleylpyruvate isomerase